MLEIMLLIILSPVAIFCGVLSIAIIYVILDKVIKIYIDFIKTIINRDDEKC